MCVYVSRHTSVRLMSQCAWGRDGPRRDGTVGRDGTRRDWIWDGTEFGTRRDMRWDGTEWDVICDGTGLGGTRHGTVYGIWDGTVEEFSQISALRNGPGYHLMSMQWHTLRNEPYVSYKQYSANVQTIGPRPAPDLGPERTGAGTSLLCDPNCNPYPSAERRRGSEDPTGSE